MKLNPPKTLKEIAELLNIPFKGNAAMQITGLNEIHMVEPGDIVFVDHPKYYDKALQSLASVVIINDDNVTCPEGKGLLISKEPFTDFNHLIRHFSPFHFSNQLIGENVAIGKSSKIHPTVVIGNNVKIGENCIIHPNVTIYDNTTIGNNVIIHANSVIGANAFYYKKRPDQLERLETCGEVVIEDFVEIGSLTTIDRGVTGVTKIGAHTKIDNHVQVGHDTQIGKKCIIAAHVGIAGCSVIEDEVTLWGQVGIPSGIVIGKGAVILAQSGVSKSLEGGKTYFGSPADEIKKKYREIAALKMILKNK